MALPLSASTPVADAQPPGKQLKAACVVVVALALFLVVLEICTMTEAEWEFQVTANKQTRICLPVAIAVAWLNVSPALSQKHRCQGMVHFYTDNSFRKFPLPVLLWIGTQHLYDREYTTATYMMIAKVFVVLWCARKALDMDCDPFRVLFIIQVETREVYLSSVVHLRATSVFNVGIATRLPELLYISLKWWCDLEKTCGFPIAVASGFCLSKWQDRKMVRI